MGPGGIIRRRDWECRSGAINPERTAGENQRHAEKPGWCGLDRRHGGGGTYHAFVFEEAVI